MWVSSAITAGFAVAVTVFCGSWAEWVICGCAVIEGLAEPFYIANLLELDMSTRVRAEAFAMTLRCITIWLTSCLGLYAFVLGQIVYSTGILLIYTVSNASPQTLWTAGLAIETPVKSAAYYFTGIACLKFFLSEGEKFILLLFSPSDQAKGEFALVSNLGSIVARFIFLPIEEVVYCVFSKKLAILEQLCETVLSVAWILALLITTYGFNYADIFVRVMYGGTWANTDVGWSLQLYSIYLSLLAVNGVTEGIAMAMSTDA
jgi:oligosaccharide translocation protein RFT1